MAINITYHSPEQEEHIAIRDFSKCPRCGAPTFRTKAFNEGESEFWLECSKCNTFINTYIPQEHQVAVHADPHRFTGNFGGYGSGKTLTSREELYKHIFITPGGNTLIGANVQSQYEQTIKRDIEADLPAAFIEAYSLQKQYYDLKNGHRIMYRPFDDPNKLRSYNLSMFIIIEASEVKAEAFVQLKSRLRNMTAAAPLRNKKGEIRFKKTKTGVPIPLIKADWRKGIIESNPDAGWIRSDVLYKSDDIQKHGRIVDTYAVLQEERDPAISSHVTATDANEFLPASFIDDLCKNKPAWWVNRFVFGSFLYAEGLVYPSAMRYVVKTFEIPSHWKRIVSHDYGLADDAVFLYGAVDEREGLVYIYREDRTNNRNIEELAKLFHEGSKDVPIGGWICPPIIDPKSAPKRDYDKKSLADHYLEYGIAFKPGHISLDARVYRLNTYLETGKLRIMDCCAGLIKEIKDYKFKPRSLDSMGWDDKPEDKNNHGINALEWITMELPADPRNLVYGIYNKQGQKWEDDEDSLEKREIAYGHYALMGEEDLTLKRDTPFDMVDYNY